MSSSPKNITQASQAGTEPSKNTPLVASPSEKQPVNGATSTPQTEGAATTNTQAPVSTPPLSEKTPAPASDSTPVPPDTEPDPLAVPPATRTTTTGGDAPAAATGPTAPVDDARERRRKMRTFIVHTRLAKFFTWLLLLGFVIFPGTFKSKGEENDHSFKNPSLLAVGYMCCFVNACGISYLWYARKTDPGWLFTNIFFAGLVNAFSGLVTAFVNIYGAHGSLHGPGSVSTLSLASMCTIIYAVLALVYHRKRKRAGYRRNSRGPNV